MQSRFSVRNMLWFLGVAAAVLVYTSQFQLYRLSVTPAVKRTAGINAYNAPYVLPTRLLQGGVLGFKNLMADYYWLSAIQYFGSGDPFGNYPQLPELLQAVTTLDPQFAYPYTFALLILPDQGFVEEAIAMGEQGLREVPRSWEIPYYLGYIYHKYKKDSAKAGELFNLAAEKPDVPAAAKLLAGIYYARGGEREIAIAIWKVAAESSTNEYTRERARAFLEHYAIIEFLEGAAKDFKVRYNRFPNDLDELKTGGVLRELPPDPIPIPLAIDQKTGVISEVLE